VSYNNLDIRSVKLVSTLMKDNFLITRFEMAPLLDVDLSQEEDSKLEQYFNNLDSWCYRNFMSKSYMNPSIKMKDEHLSSPTITTPKQSFQSVSNGSPSSIMTQRKFSIERLNMQSLSTQILETIDTYDDIRGRPLTDDQDMTLLQVLNF
jgi:hypothetical protein